MKNKNFVFRALRLAKGSQNGNGLKAKIKSKTKIKCELKSKIMSRPGCKSLSKDFKRQRASQTLSEKGVLSDFKNMPCGCCPLEEPLEMLSILFDDFRTLGPCEVGPILEGFVGIGFE